MNTNDISKHLRGWWPQRLRPLFPDNPFLAPGHLLRPLLLSKSSARLRSLGGLLLRRPRGTWQSRTPSPQGTATALTEGGAPPSSLRGAERTRGWGWWQGEPAVGLLPGASSSPGDSRPALFGPTLRSVPTLSVTRSFLPALHLGVSGNPTSPPPTPRQSPGPQGAGAEGPCGA